MVNGEPAFPWPSLLAAAAGGVTALTLVPWKTMSWLERFLTVFVGFSFAVFATPWLAVIIFGPEGTHPKVLTGLTYVMASGVNVILPALFRRVTRLVGDNEQEAK